MSWSPYILYVYSYSNYSQLPEPFTNTQPLLLQDFAIELRLEDFTFRWETNVAGHRISAQVISTQIIMPLMSTAHLAFSSSSPIGEMSESELEAVSAPWPLDCKLMTRHGLHACTGPR